VAARQLGLAGALAAVLLTGCAGQRCEALPTMRADRDAARAAYLELATSRTATTSQTERADAVLHALERRVHDLEQGCGGR